MYLLDNARSFKASGHPVRVCCVGGPLDGFDQLMHAPQDTIVFREIAPHSRRAFWYARAAPRLMEFNPNTQIMYLFIKDGDLDCA